MQTTKWRVFSSIICLFIVAIIVLNNNGLYDLLNAPINGGNDIAKLNGCTIQNNRCEFTLDQQKFEVTFSQTPIPEEEIQFLISSPADFHLLNAWVEGINMYMGKSPVIAKTNTANSLDGIFFLGSCNLNTMEWRMVLNFKQKTHPVEVRFKTTI